MSHRSRGQHSVRRHPGPVRPSAHLPRPDRLTRPVEAPGRPGRLRRPPGQALLDRAVAGLVAGRLSGADAAKPKPFRTDTRAIGVDRCLQLFGGQGYMLEYPIARLYADETQHPHPGRDGRGHEGGHRQAPGAASRGTRRRGTETGHADREDGEAWRTSPAGRGWRSSRVARAASVRRSYGHWRHAAARWCSPTGPGGRRPRPSPTRRRGSRRSPWT
ncbi:acyl-CoA dehydrogenase family protein [Streptomyces zaehneri]|uniref:acyl-CoA dehydrogenase family protein n=1 Tax=Streptomyces zaehneri TaxID=3051180 RepID=UPI0028D7616D|nr:acyl-CoA dehydrogenase family protein [Streptomyces sp. DSM 40713]